MLTYALGESPNYINLVYKSGTRTKPEDQFGELNVLLTKHW